MKRSLSTSIAALATIFLTVPASAADLGGSKDPTSAEYVAPERPFTWTGFYFGGQAGYGIANHETTTVSTEHFDATPSRCWKDFSITHASTDDNDTEDTSDDSDTVFGTDFNFSKTNVSEEDCKDFLHTDEFGTETETDDGWTKTVTKAYDEAVAAHDVVTTSNSKHSDSGFVGGGVVGYDQQIGRFIIGVFAEYNWADLDGFNSDWAGGGRIGFLIDPRLMAYGLVAYTQADYEHATYEGWKFGGGLEYAVKRNVFVGAQYTYTDYDEETIVDVPGLLVKDDLDEHRILGTLKIKLNSDIGETFGF